MGQELKFKPIQKSKINTWREDVIKFVWVKNDCFSAICLLIDVMYKTDYYDQQLKYDRSPRSAIKYFKNQDILKALKQIGFKEKDYKYAQTGDIYYSVVNNKECTAINLIDNVLMTDNKNFYVCKKNEQVSNCMVLGI
jgi:hypothetical protein